MPIQTTSPPLTVTVLGALWVSLVRCDVSESAGLGCDNGKLYLDIDLPDDVLYWDCPASAWPEATQTHPGVDTVYNPEPARQICMNESISYNHTIPSRLITVSQKKSVCGYSQSSRSSYLFQKQFKVGNWTHLIGAYRPVRAENGEYLYCPPQRWLNNLHLGATVLLHHPCAALHERRLLSHVARSCLPHYIITPYPWLNNHMPIALVSWGRTLELSTLASSHVCDWLETTTSARNGFDGASRSRKYNLLLFWSAEQHRQQHAHPEEHSAKMKGSLRQCCEQTISSLLNGMMRPESSLKKERFLHIKATGKSRQIRAAMSEIPQNVQNENKDEKTVIYVPTGDPQSSNSTLRPSSGPSLRNRTLFNIPGTKDAPSQSKTQNTSEGVSPRPTLTLGSNMSETFRTEPLGFAVTNPNPTARLDDHVDGGNSEHNHATRPEALAHNPKDEDTGSVNHGMKNNDSKEKQSDTDSTAGGIKKDNQALDVKERELEYKKANSDRGNHPSATYLPSSHDCDGCKAGEQCECNKSPEARASVANKGLQRTPRTDEAVWAAAALGFLLVLLTLSVLHTRLYRYWRVTPSLYWHDPQQDYDSVADVIRRRLRIANRRRKRGRRQECVLLPSSSSSDELP